MQLESNNCGFWIMGLLLFVAVVKFSLVCFIIAIDRSTNTRRFARVFRFPVEISISQRLGCSNARIW